MDFETETFVVAPTLCDNGKASGSATQQDAESGALIVADNQRETTHTLRASGFDASEDETGRGTPLVPVAYRTSGNCGVTEQGQKTAALNCASDPTQTIVAFSGRNRGAERAVNRPERPPHCMIGKVGAIDSTKPWNVGSSQGVRRLMPVETERLQGFPDNWTAFGASGTRFSDGPRYAMCGNAVAAPCARWLGSRIVRATRT